MFLLLSWRGMSGIAIFMGSSSRTCAQLRYRRAARFFCRVAVLVTVATAVDETAEIASGDGEKPASA